MQLSRISLSRVNRVFGAAWNQLCDHSEKPQIARAASELRRRDPSVDRTFDYHVLPYNFVNIEVARRLIFEDKKDLAGLQIASNYGPYLHFLKHDMGIQRVIGIDVNPYAVKYGGEIGSPVIFGDARHFPVRDNSCDLIISNNFLDTLYPYSVPGQIIVEQAAKALKPGGVFISDLEGERWAFINSGLFTQNRFSEEVLTRYRFLENLHVFQARE